MDVSTLLRVLPLALRGCSTPELPFDSNGNIVLSEDISFEITSILPPLSEPCTLNKYIELTLKTVKPANLTAQALFSCIREQMHGFLELISNMSFNSIADAQLKLSSPTVYLRLFATVLKTMVHSNSPQSVLSLLSDYRFHGDPLIRKYSHVLYDAAFLPFNQLKQEWEDFGSLKLDKFGEFYVRKTPSTSTHRSPEFELVKANIPKGIEIEDAERSFERGIAINFLREVCGQTEFDGTGKSLQDVNMFTHNLLMTKYKLMLHFKGLRDYMLLTSSNFVEALFKNARDDILTKTMSEVGVHQSKQFFIGAVEDISYPPQDDLDVLESIDAYVLGMGKQEHSTMRVWEAFCGKYHFKSKALQAIIEPAIMVDYERCFMSLWRIQLSIHAMTNSVIMLGQWGKGRSSFNIEMNEVYACMNRVSSYMNMNVLGLASFVYYEVIDRYWEILKRKMSKNVLTLSEITSAHSSYLKGIVSAVAAPERANAIGKITEMVLELEGWLLNGTFPTVEDIESFKTEFSDQIGKLKFRSQSKTAYKHTNSSSSDFANSERMSEGSVQSDH